MHRTIIVMSTCWVVTMAGFFVCVCASHQSRNYRFSITNSVYITSDMRFYSDMIFFCVEKIHLFSTCFLPVCLRILWNRINRIKWVKNYTDWLVRPQPDTLPKRQVSKTIKCSFLHGPSSYFHGIWWHFEDYTKCTIKKLA